MQRSYGRRWRHTRDTIPGRRRRRRTHRRDRKRGGTYYPMEVDPKSARRGVQARLVGAVGAVSVTLGCLMYFVFHSITAFAAMAPDHSFGLTMVVTVGLCSFSAAVALLLSARREEQVHELADQLGRPDPPATDATSPEVGLAPGEGRDGGRRALPEPDPLQADVFAGDRAVVFDADRRGGRRSRPGVRVDRPSSNTDGAV